MAGRVRQLAEGRDFLRAGGDVRRIRRELELLGDFRPVEGGGVLEILAGRTGRAEAAVNARAPVRDIAVRWRSPGAADREWPKRDVLSPEVTRGPGARGCQTLF